MDDRKGATKTPGGGTITYDTEPEGPGFYYALPGNPPMRDWGPFPSRDIAKRWHETPSSISDEDIAAIRKLRGFE